MDTVANTAFILTDDLGHHDFIHFNGQGIYTLGEQSEQVTCTMSRSGSRRSGQGR